ncbi:MAG: DNRLRE domain-containing protein [Bacteroidota bacterium]
MIQFSSRYFRLSFFCSAIVILFLAGCSDDPPNSVGAGILPQKDGLTIIPLDTIATGSESYLQRISGSSTLLMFGKYQDNEALALMLFNLDSTRYTRAQILSATVSFQISYRYKDSIGTVGLQLHNVRRTWTEGTFTWDSLFTNGTVTPGSYSDTVLVDSTVQIPAGDSTLTINLNPNVVPPWISAAQASLILIPDSATTTMILGFSSINSSVNLKPKLTIVYRDTIDSTHVDSIFTTQKVFIANGVLPTVNHHFFTQGSIVERGLLRFDVSGIPKNAGITEANLQLTLDTVLSKRGYSTDNSILAQMAIDDSARPDMGGLYGLGTFQNSTLITFPITQIVQQWVTKNTNHGIVIHVNQEYLNFDRYAFYDTGALSLLRPKLFIKYTAVH